MLLKYLLAFILIFGFSFTLWSLVGFARLIIEYLFKLRPLPLKPNSQGSLAHSHQVAICMAAHNEQLVIADALGALKKIIFPAHIYVANDASKDSTSAIAKNQGCQVYDVFPNRGKAGALAALLKHFDIYHRYKYVVFVDADTRLRRDYLLNALPVFNDKSIAAVAGYARSQWKNNIFIAYRSRIWFTIQTFFRFGMSSKFFNLNMIVPGFASMYRTRALARIDIAKPGLVIEDYNMTFELQKKKLGKIVHYPNITGYTQDPHTFKSYTAQIKRWNLGFWQTVRANGVWPSFFWLNLIVYLVEVLLTSLIFLIFPLFFISALLLLFISLFISISPFYLSLALFVMQWSLILLVLDYLYTILTALVQRRPQLLFYAPTMLFFRWLDAYYFFAGLILAFTTKSSGTWKSPERWQAGQAAVK